MSSIPDRNNERFQVVINSEGQYSIWAEYKKVPLGWQTVGITGEKKECLDYIRDAWSDMRPLSLRQAQNMSLQKVV
jgi:MbtH protein